MAYVPTVWETGDVITADKLNRLEQGVEDAAAAELPSVAAADNDQVLTVVGGEWDAAPIPSQLPQVTGSDNGKILKVVEGVWDKADASSALIVTGTYDETTTKLTLNKTWQEIYNALSAGHNVVCTHNYIGTNVAAIDTAEHIIGSGQDEGYYVSLPINGGFFLLQADSANGYPSVILD